ncbi:hypothetical protein Tco_1440027 [Tanacetum coccineum]
MTTTLLIENGSSIEEGRVFFKFNVRVPIGKCYHVLDLQKKQINPIFRSLQVSRADADHAMMSRIREEYVGQVLSFLEIDLASLSSKEAKKHGHLNNRGGIHCNVLDVVLKSLG